MLMLDIFIWQIIVAVLQVLLLVRLRFLIISHFKQLLHGFWSQPFDTEAHKQVINRFYVDSWVLGGLGCQVDEIVLDEGEVFPYAAGCGLHLADAGAFKVAFDHPEFLI